MAAIDPRQIYNYLLQKGVSPASAAGILANIQYESGFRTDAVGDNGTSGGLFQHHGSRWTNLKNYAASSGRSWTDWTAQVDFALKEAKAMGLNLNHTNAAAASKEWTLKFERPANAAAKAEQRARAVSKYTYGSGGEVTLPGGSGSGNAAASGNEAINLPSGGSWFKAKDGSYYVAYRFYANADRTGSSQVVYYKSATPPPSGTKIYSTSTWEQYKASWVDGGTTDAWRGAEPGKSFQEHVNDVLMQLGLAGSDALKDPGVMAIVALAMTREMSPAELSNRLRQTKWYQSRTDKQREWNDLSDAEKGQRLMDEASKLSGLWFTYVGQDINMGQYDKNKDGIVSPDELKAGNKMLYTWAQRIASGEASQAQAVNGWMKDEARKNPESPWSRTVRNEEQEKGQHKVDVSNMTGQIRDMYLQWGMKISDAKAQKLAEDVVMNRMSLEDVEKSLKKSANGYYTTKPPDVSTRDWAEPYIQTYQMVLETGEPDFMSDQLMQRALRSGMNLAEFEKMLRQDDRWLKTKGARTEFNDKISDLGRIMGF